jgi:hypothetical protein
VVAGQHLMQASSDIFLGWLRARPTGGHWEDYYLRQLWDWKLSAVIEDIKPPSMEVYGRLCGWTVAGAHARAGDRIAIAAYLGNSAKFDNAIADFAETYADQNQRDLPRSAAVAADASRRSPGRDGARCGRGCPPSFSPGRASPRRRDARQRCASTRGRHQSDRWP